MTDAATPATVTLDVAVPADHPSFAGHFPGDPLWPGVLLLAEAMEAIAAEPALAAAVGATPRLSVAKFLSPVRPGARLAVHAARAGAGVDFRIVDADDPARVCAEGRFALAPVGPR